MEATGVQAKDYLVKKTRQQTKKKKKCLKKWVAEGGKYEKKEKITMVDREKDRPRQREGTGSQVEEW